MIATSFPSDTDHPPTEDELAAAREFYARAYDRPEPEKPIDEAYVRIAERAAKEERIEEKVRAFVNQYGLTGKRVLDVGAGRGYLQDVVEDYTALDISPSARRFFHKRFVLGSATAMPFGEGEFDAAWSIWVLEHVFNPEQMLREVRRVVKNGGLLYLRPAWDCTPWAADGYGVRPYGDFGLWGKLTKASIPLRLVWWRYSKVPVRLLRYASVRASGGPSALHYTRLKPNYEKYWEADSDAVNSLDSFETALWFLSRGDACLNCSGWLEGLSGDPEVLVIRIHKSRGPAREER